MNSSRQPILVTLDLTPLDVSDLRSALVVALSQSKKYDGLLANRSVAYMSLLNRLDDSFV